MLEENNVVSVIVASNHIVHFGVQPRDLSVNKPMDQRSPLCQFLSMVSLTNLFILLQHHDSMGQTVQPPSVLFSTHVGLKLYELLVHRHPRHIKRDNKANARVFKGINMTEVLRNFVMLLTFTSTKVQLVFIYLIS